MFTQSFTFFGTYGDKQNFNGVDFNYPEVKTEEGRVFELCSFPNPKKEVIVQFTDQYRAVSFETVKVEILVQNSTVVQSFVIEGSEINDTFGNLQFKVPVVEVGEKVDVGLRFEHSVHAFVILTGDIFVFSVDGDVMPIINIPAS